MNNFKDIILLFGGDFIPPTQTYNIYSENLLDVLKDKDFSIINLEAPLTRCTQKIRKTGNNFKSSPESVKYLVDGNFNAVCLSNNHIRDFGNQGVLDTLNNCKNYNILTVGGGLNSDQAAQPLSVSINSKKISFLNYSEKEFNIAGPGHAGANSFDLIDAFYQIKGAKKDNDYVIVIYHGGLEYHYLPSTEIIKRFKFFVDAGADSVVSHHTHRYSGMMLHKNKPIFFGLGNFFASTKTAATDSWLKGIMVQLKITETGIYHRIIPTKMASDFGSVDLLEGHEKQKILEHFDKFSEKISDEKAIQSYWEDIYCSSSDRFTNLIKSDSRLEFRLRKRLPKIFKTELSQYKLLTILNLFRCDAHRDQVVKVLENMYNGIKGK